MVEFLTRFISAKTVAIALGYDIKPHPFAFDKKVYHGVANKIEELLKEKCLEYSRSWQWSEADKSVRFRVSW